MKPVLIILLLSASLPFCNSKKASNGDDDLLMKPSATNADTTLSSQLNKVFTSADSEFGSLKGKERKLGTGEIVSESLLTLSETSENTIGLSQSKPYYKAIV